MKYVVSGLEGALLDAAKLGAEVDLQEGAQQRASGDAFAAAFPNIRLAKTSP